MRWRRDRCCVIPGRVVPTGNRRAGVRGLSLRRRPGLRKKGGGQVPQGIIGIVVVVIVVIVVPALLGVL